MSRLADRASRWFGRIDDWAGLRVGRWLCAAPLLLVLLIVTFLLDDEWGVE